ncbi:sulfite exporter TauE/SafE family protein [Halogeometricum sp. S1BR25-6]|uniref:Probable membrane transporter protein n=1 Tax=Halogeometricum salsisoli TaxID=2950536 RepID=A0ABU2GDM7_9EURY|nr:sulfite exporter TauE/SafE family protein [Halogeometricum sp. S1BR25-6]MDS0298921.1 sulfite exporter TauE/SafE family protein [Halogeometricum sp. S1BR25-6]
MATDNARVDPAQFLEHLRAFRYREVTMTAAAFAVLVGAVVLFPGAENVTAGIRADVGATTLAVFVAVAILAGAIKGMLGFGYALVATPVFATVIDPTLAVVVLAIPPWMINMFQIGETDTGLDFVREEWLLMLLAGIGAVLGVSFLAAYSTGPIVPFLIGLVIFGYVLFQVLQGFVTVEEAHHPVALSTAGFLEGFLLAVSNLGPLLPAYFHTFERDAERYIGGLSMVLGLIFTVRIVQMALFTDLMTTYRLWLGCVIAVVTLVGLLAGTYLRRVEVNETWFNRFVVGLLFVISLNIFRKTVPALFF